MAETDGQGRLFTDPPAPEGVVVIDDRCVVRTGDEHRVVIVSGVVLAPPSRRAPPEGAEYPKARATSF